MWLSWLLACTSAGAPSPVPEPPWTVVFADGRHNVTRVTQPADAPGTWTYEPMTPERSSSGHFSGGAPATGPLDADAARALWTRLHAIQRDPASLTDTRRMGTGRLTLEAAAETAQVLLVPAAAQDLAALLAGWR